VNWESFEMENRNIPTKRLKVEEPAGCFFHGSPGSPYDFQQIIQHLQGFRTTATQRDFLNTKERAETYARFDFYVGFSYGCRVLIDILNEVVNQNLVSHDSLKRKRVFLIAPYLVGESKALQKVILNLPIVGDFILSMKREKIAREFGNKIASPFEPASRLLECLDTYSNLHFKNAVFEKKDFPPKLSVLSNFRTSCLVPEKDSIIDTNSVANTFSQYGKIEILKDATHSCLWTHSLPISDWISIEFTKN
jgi:hypothetical protein